MAGKLSINRRSVVNILVLSGGVMLLYLTLTIMASAMYSTGGGIAAAPSDLPVSIKSIIPAANGKLDLTLSINIDDIIKHLDGYRHANGEATSNPVPMNTSFVKNVPSLCEDSPNIKVIVVVHTSPGNKARRQNLRKTWGNTDLFQDGRMKVVFMAGLPATSSDQEILDNEHLMFKDIVQGNFLDNYKNLTLKAIMGLKWVSQYCKQSKFVLKADDDAFINIFEVQKLITKNEHRKRLVTCPLWKENSMPILRDPAKCMKWCVKYSEFPGMNYFPQYCAGLSFMLTTDIVADMYTASLTTPFFWIDDVYITGILLSKVENVGYLDVMKNFTLKEKIAAEEYLSDVPTPKVIFSHIKNEEKWHAMWHATLNRLSDAELLSLSRSVLDNNKELTDRWNKLKSR